MLKVGRGSRGSRRWGSKKKIEISDPTSAKHLKYNKSGMVSFEEIRHINQPDLSVKNNVKEIGKTPVNNVHSAKYKFLTGEGKSLHFEVN